MDLQNYVVVSPCGTWFEATNAMLLDTTLLSDDELDALENGTDAERWEVCNKYGIRLSQSR